MTHFHSRLFWWTNTCFVITRNSAKRMTSNEKPPDGISKGHQQLPADTNGRDYAVIADKTAAAIAAQGQPPLAANRVPPGNQQQLPSKPRTKRPADYSRGSCRMFFPTSGHMGFELIKTSDEFPPIETIREMIDYETRIRLSEPLQELMDMYCKDEAAVT